MRACGRRAVTRIAGVSLYDRLSVSKCADYPSSLSCSLGSGTGCRSASTRSGSPLDPCPPSLCQRCPALHWRGRRSVTSSPPGHDSPRRRQKSNGSDFCSLLMIVVGCGTRADTTENQKEGCISGMSRASADRKENRAENRSGDITLSAAGAKAKVTTKRRTR